jgi:hypothetical protein
MATMIVLSNIGKAPTQAERQFQPQWQCLHQLVPALVHH